MTRSRRVSACTVQSREHLSFGLLQRIETNLFQLSVCFDDIGPHICSPELSCQAVGAVTAVSVVAATASSTGDTFQLALSVKNLTVYSLAHFTPRCAL